MLCFGDHIALTETSECALQVNFCISTYIYEELNNLWISVWSIKSQKTVKNVLYNSTESHGDNLKNLCGLTNDPKSKQIHLRMI